MLNLKNIELIYNLLNTKTSLFIKNEDVSLKNILNKELSSYNLIINELISNINYTMRLYNENHKHDNIINKLSEYTNRLPVEGCEV